MVKKVQGSDILKAMNYRMQQQAKSRTVLSCFDQVAKLRLRERFAALCAQCASTSTVVSTFFENFAEVSLDRLNHERTRSTRAVEFERHTVKKI